MWDGAVLVFFIEWAVPSSRPVPALGIEDVLKHPDRDVGTLAGWLCPDT